MTNPQAPLTTNPDGLTAFDRLLREEYGLPLDHWTSLPTLDDRERDRLAKALEVLILQPIADHSDSSDEMRSGEIGSLRQWQLSDEKIAGRDWEQSWQWQLIAAIDNGTRNETSGMMTPSDPRLFLLRIRYGKGLFPALADYLGRIFCGRSGIRQAPDTGSVLRQVPGFETASPTFIAGLSFFIDKLGRDDFCDFCDDLS